MPRPGTKDLVDFWENPGAPDATSPRPRMVELLDLSIQELLEVFIAEAKRAELPDLRIEPFQDVPSAQTDLLKGVIAGLICYLEHCRARSLAMTW